MGCAANASCADGMMRYLQRPLCREAPQGTRTRRGARYAACSPGLHALPDMDKGVILRPATSLA